MLLWWIFAFAAAPVDEGYCTHPHVWFVVVPKLHSESHLMSECLFCLPVVYDVSMHVALTVLWYVFLSVLFV
jgi:hypothetical protein